jgi:N-methylhydantoinase B
VTAPDGNSREQNSKGTFMAPADCEILFEVPGSGGYGPPEERDHDKIRADLRDGYVTAEAVERDYGFIGKTRGDEER